jgi:hypothetical protein
VLTERLEQLEAGGLVHRVYLEPPAASTVYELTNDGLALRPVVHELIRWGARRLLPPRPGEQLEAEWVQLALEACARRDPSPPRTFLTCMPDGRQEVRLRIAGSASGTTVERASVRQTAVDTVVRASPRTILALASGVLDPGEAVRTGQADVQGQGLDDLPALFDMSIGGTASAEGDSE